MGGKIRLQSMYWLSSGILIAERLKPGVYRTWIWYAKHINGI